MKYTGNFKLKKPEGSDVVNIDDFNDNTDILDREMAKKATTSQDGRMSKEDKAKLDGIESGANSIPAGTKMLFYQASAPAGWTKYTGINDRMLRVVSGNGGGTGGTWTFSGLSLDVLGHKLTIAEMPKHRHSHQDDSPSGNSTGLLHRGGANEGTRYTRYTSYEGGSQSHDHGITYSHNGNWRPAYADVIICTKK